MITVNLIMGVLTIILMQVIVIQQSNAAFLSPLLSPPLAHFPSFDSSRRKKRRQNRKFSWKREAHFRRKLPKNPNEHFPPQPLAYF